MRTCDKDGSPMQIDQQVLIDSHGTVQRWWCLSAGHTVWITPEVALKPVSPVRERRLGQVHRTVTLRCPECLEFFEGSRRATYCETCRLTYQWKDSMAVGGAG